MAGDTLDKKLMAAERGEVARREKEAANPLKAAEILLAHLLIPSEGDDTKDRDNAVMRALTAAGVMGEEPLSDVVLRAQKGVSKAAASHERIAASATEMQQRILGATS